MERKNFIEELTWRGMIHTIMPGAKEQDRKSTRLNSSHIL